jgi:translation initiation factor 1 (eIF-1/SUI1)
MARRQFAALAATLFVAGTLGSIGAQAQGRKFAATVIVACDHSVGTELATRVSGIETAGRVADSLAAALQARTSCAEVFNLLALGGFELVHRLAGPSGDYNGDGDVDGRDFLIWQRGGSPAPARPSVRVTTVLLSCEYEVTDRLVTRVAGSEIAGAIDASLAAALATRPSCSEAYAALAGAGFGLVSAGPAPPASPLSASDLADWQSNYGTSGL